MKALLNYRNVFNHRLKTNAYLSTQKRSNLLRLTALNILIGTRSKYDFSIKAFDKQRINQLLNPNAYLYLKYKEMLILEDSHEFIYNYYHLDEALIILINYLISYYNRNVFFLPNYLPLIEVYSILSNWMKQKQKMLDDIHHLDYSTCHVNYNDMNIHSSIELFSHLNNKSSNIKRKKSLRYKLLIPHNYYIAKQKPKRADDTIVSLEKFTHYLNLFKDDYITPRQKESLSIPPKKKKIANVSRYAKSNFLFTLNSHNSKAITEMEFKGIKAYLSNYSNKPQKSEIMLKKKLLHRGNSRKFIKTEAFFDNLKEKESNAFKFPVDANKCIEIQKHHYLSKYNTSSRLTSALCTSVQSSSTRKEIINKISCFSQEKTINAKSFIINTMGNRSSNIKDRTKLNHIREYCDSKSSQFHCHTMSSTIIKKNNLNKKTRSISSFGDYVDELNLVIQNAFKQSKGEGLNKKSIREQKKYAYLANIENVKIQKALKSSVNYK